MAVHASNFFPQCLVDQNQSQVLLAFLVSSLSSRNNPGLNYPASSDPLKYRIRVKMVILVLGGSSSMKRRLGLALMNLAVDIL